MGLSKKDLKAAQDLLDAGKSFNAVSNEFGVCNKTIKRHVDKGNLMIHEDIVFPVDQVLETPYNWLEYEDALEQISDEAFTEMFVKFPEVISRKSPLSDYVIDKYGSLKAYFQLKGGGFLCDMVFIYCGSCKGYKPLSKWHKCNGRSFGMTADCGECVYGRSYKISVTTQHNRLAHKRSLPDTLTETQRSGTYTLFKDKCSLTGESKNLNMEHTLPLGIGHGGTTRENIVPMRMDLNISKGDRNVFEWFESNRERFNLNRRKFDDMIAYLAKVNGVTTKEYRDFVFWCHDNPRTVEHTEIDNAKYGYKKPSIEIWKETKGAIE